MIGCDLIRDLIHYKIPYDYFVCLDKKVGITLINPNDLPSQNILNDIEIYFGDRITPNLVSRMPNLKWIHLTSVGYDKLTGLDNKDIIITNSKGIMDEAVVSSAISFIFVLARGIHHCVELKSQIDRYVFEEYADNVQTVFGQTCMIVGMGNIGNKLKSVCEALGMTVLGIGRDDNLRENIRDADYVVNLLPHNKDTNNIFDFDIFKLMKKSSFFINVGRGKTVVEEDLIEAVNLKEIAGAGLDVFETEPLFMSSKLRSISNVVITPHIAGYSNCFWEKQKELFSGNLEKYLNNEEMVNNVRL